MARFEYSTLMLSQTGRSRFDFVPAHGGPRESFVNCRQFLWRRVVFGTGELCLDFERELCQLPLPVFRPGGNALQYCLNLVLGHDVLSDPGRPVSENASAVDAAHAEVFDFEEFFD